MEHLLEDATDELKRMEELESAGKELEKNKEERPVSQKMFRQSNMDRMTCALLRQFRYIFHNPHKKSKPRKSCQT